MAASPKYSVLFICSGNSARSQFAEAILRKIGSQKFDAYSTGTTAADRYAECLCDGDSEQKKITTPRVCGPKT